MSQGFHKQVVVGSIPIPGSIFMLEIRSRGIDYALGASE